MLSFLKYVSATLVGLMIFFFLSVLFVVMIGVIGSSSPTTEIKSGSILKLDLNQAIPELASRDIFQKFRSGSDGDEMMGLVELKKVLKAVKDDDRYDGIYLKATYPQVGFAVLDEIRAALLDFKKSGKFIYSYGQFFSESGIYMSSIADSLFVHPEAVIEFNGLGAEITYYKDFFEKIGVKPQVFKVGDYKSAVEPYLRQTISDENREQTQEFIDEIYDEFITKLADHRNLPKDHLMNIADSMLVTNGREAVKAGLADRLSYYDEVVSLLNKSVGKEANDKLKLVSFSSALGTVELDESSSDERIAVIVGEGVINVGNNVHDEIGGRGYANLIAKARNDDKVKAIVLRINSPGGSFHASEDIWREVELTKGVKPIIASMSDYAASGGYYMAMNCEKVYAASNTLTGSIGIYSMMFSAENLIENKMGLNTEVVKTGHFSDIETMTRDLSPYELSILQKGSDEGYDTFTKKAALGRGISQDAIKSVASGRVWTGSTAIGKELVDEIGTLEDAVQYAAEESDSEDFSIEYYPKPADGFDRLMSDFPLQVEQKYLKWKLGGFYSIYRKVDELKSQTGIQARMPFEIAIR